MQFCDCVFTVSRQIDILELKDLEREYILARSRLTLAEQDSPSTAIAGTTTRSQSIIITTTTTV